MAQTLPALNQDPRARLKTMDCFALDLDGTLFVGRRWIDGARDFLEALTQSGRRTVFLTNNSSRSTAGHLHKLAEMGLKATPDMLVSSGEATIAWLKAHHPGRRVYLLGTALLAAEFAAAGILLDDETPEVVVTSYDTALTYKKLARACRHVRAGLPYAATHPDINCPSEEGPLPDIGAIHAFIEASTGRRPQHIIGKPHPPILAYLAQKTGAKPEETALVGDRLYTDIAGAQAGGLLPVLVLSGETRAEDLAASEARPALVFSSVREMIPFL